MAFMAFIAGAGGSTQEIARYDSQMAFGHALDPAQPALPDRHRLHTVKVGLPPEAFAILAMATAPVTLPGVGAALVNAFAAGCLRTAPLP